ncbi:chemotaxis protein CheX [Bacillus sp. HMF5848]|uniref:chemotaxis protein CheX n=1 Tax=Bacillus sp. HMF5848 TaxID=2495421 RepID=UPI000F7B97CA|nr:chemotaxis protein CheX [Bacillus sp. HMF5848]RSK27332.1 chemotaxis protein CheX [Bacillus sp. HMF5848]
MSTSTNITHVLNATVDALRGVIPLNINIHKPALFTQPLLQSSIGVLIGMTGDVRGRLILESSKEVFGGIGQVMFGMALEGEMLESFTGELGNMIAGNLTTVLSNKDITMDITPPTVIVGETKMYGFDKAFKVPVEVADLGELQVILMLEMK